MDAAWDFCGRQIALGPEYEAAMDIAVVLKSVRDRGILDDPNGIRCGSISSEYLAKMGFKERARISGFASRVRLN